MSSLEDWKNMPHIVAKKQMGMTSMPKEDLLIDIETVMKGAIGWFEHMKALGYDLGGDARFMMYALFARDDRESVARLLKKFAQRPIVEERKRC